MSDLSLLSVTSVKKSLSVVLKQNLKRIQSGGQPSVSESSKVHIIKLSSYIITFYLRLILSSAGLQLSANTEESNEADKNLFRLTPYGALPDW